MHRPSPKQPPPTAAATRRRTVLTEAGGLFLRAGELRAFWAQHNRRRRSRVVELDQVVKGLLKGMTPVGNAVEDQLRALLAEEFGGALGAELAEMVTLSSLKQAVMELTVPDAATAYRLERVGQPRLVALARHAAPQSRIVRVRIRIGSVDAPRSE